MSFSADGALAIMVFFRKSGPAPNSFAQGRAIDMSIQFLLFWTPLVTLLGWWLDKPMSLLFGKYCLTFVLSFFFFSRRETLQIYLKSCSSSGQASSSTQSRETGKRTGLRASFSCRST
jgi:hypothetical protein